MRVELIVLAPVTGRAVPLRDVPDPVFAQAMVGPGVAVDPMRSAATAVAPVDGLIVKLHPHAYVVVGEAGRGVLVHLGIDTVQLAGTGFRLLAEEGQQVAAGTPVVAWDPAAVESGGRPVVCPVIALDAPAEAVQVLAESSDVTAGDALFAWR
jgi:sugar PTS system EIIA component